MGGSIEKSRSGQHHQQQKMVLGEPRKCGVIEGSIKGSDSPHLKLANVARVKRLASGHLRAELKALILCLGVVVDDVECPGVGVV